MGLGVQVFNANATSQFDTSFALARNLIRFDTGRVDGSITVPNVDGQKVPMIMFARLGQATPSVTISGNVVSWTFGSIPAPYRADCAVLVMVK